MSPSASASSPRVEAARVVTGGEVLDADVAVPAGARGVVLFAHGSGSGRASVRNRAVAEALWRAGFGTVLVDLLTADEARVDAASGHLRFDVQFLADRVAVVTDWLGRDLRTRALPVGYYGASTGAGAALVAAVARPAVVRAVVARGGRVDLAGPALARVRAPTLLVVGGDDAAVLELNRAALPRFAAEARLEVVPGASHLFEEPGALGVVADLAAAWFARHLAGAGASPHAARGA